jgi:Transglycosylase SLT domain
MRINYKRASWTLVATFLIAASAQPTANGLDLPGSTQLYFPEVAALNITTGPALENSVMTPLAKVFAPDMSRVALMARQVEIARTPSGAKYVTRQLMMEQYQWGKVQFACLNRLWTKESNWNYKAHNYKSGAHGIPQALPANKMALISADWRTNPVTQISWGLRYIEDRYSNPCKAWSKFKRSRFY